MKQEITWNEVPQKLHCPLIDSVILIKHGP